MKHTIDTSWDFMFLELDGPAAGGGADRDARTGAQRCADRRARLRDHGARRIYGVRWADGHELLFADMPEQQTRAYLKRKGIGDPKKVLKARVTNRKH